MNTRHRPTRALRSSSLVRMAMRISRSRWFSFLRRVLIHYHNGSRSDLASNPFNSNTWMLMQFLVLVVQISITTFTIAISKEKPLGPIQIWIVGYNISCVLSLLLLYGRYQHHLNHGYGLGLSDVEQQRGSQESRSTDRGASDDQILQLPSWFHTHCNPDLGNEDPNCCICLAKYEDNQELRQLPCSHVFHLNCVDKWLQIRSFCPLCKQELER